MLEPTTLNGKGVHTIGSLPRDLRDRNDFVGVAIYKSPTGYATLRFSLSIQLLAQIGKPKRVTVRGTPEDGYLITAGDDLKPAEAGSTRLYINVSAEKVGAPRDVRQQVWLRAEVEHKRIRVPPLPPAWIGGEPEFMPGTVCEETDRNMQLGKTAGDDAVRVSSTSAPIAATVPPAKPTIDYKLPEGIGIAEAQALLGRKLDEARAIMRELEKRTGMKLTLTRNFTITLDLTGK